MEAHLGKVAVLWETPAWNTVTSAHSSVSKLCRGTSPSSRADMSQGLGFRV
jgi:hypothetical protein